MQAVVYSGPRDVSIKNVPDAKIERATDVLIKVTTTISVAQTFTCITGTWKIGRYPRGSVDSA